MSPTILPLRNELILLNAFSSIIVVNEYVYGAISLFKPNDFQNVLKFWYIRMSSRQLFKFISTHVSRAQVASFVI